MPRPDYERFKKEFDTNCTICNCFIISDNDTTEKEQFQPFSKICYHNIVIETNAIAKTSNLGIDVFPIDGLPDGRQEREKELKRARALKRILVHAEKDRSSLNKFDGIKRPLVKIFHVLSKMYGKKRALKNLDTLSRKCDFSSSPMCGIVSWATYGIGESYPTSGFDNMVELEFEGYKFFSINCWDYYLHGLYGDYMKIPPESERKTHEMEAYALET